MRKPAYRGEQQEIVESKEEESSFTHAQERRMCDDFVVDSGCTEHMKKQKISRGVKPESAGVDGCRTQ